MARRGSRNQGNDLQLSLPFLAADGGAAAAPAPAVAVPPVTTAAPAPPAAPAAPHQHPLQRLLRHPRSNREARLGDHVVGYELRRARRRTIGFVVADDGLAVSAPRWVPAAEIESALQEKAPWILRKLQEQGERLQRMDARCPWATSRWWAVPDDQVMHSSPGGRRLH
jgi:hypothetical protein